MLWVYAHKFDNLGKMCQFLKNDKVPWVNQVEINILNNFVTIKETEFVI